jgi:hypothetical protein
LLDISEEHVVANETAGLGADIDEWSSSKVYERPGLRVQYEGKVYESNYWSLNLAPAFSREAWTLIGDVPESKVTRRRLSVGHADRPAFAERSEIRLSKSRSVHGPLYDGCLSRPRRRFAAYTAHSAVTTLRFGSPLGSVQLRKVATVWAV